MKIESEKINMTPEGSLVGVFTAITQKGRKLYAVVTENRNKTGSYWIQNEKNKVIHNEFNLADFNTAWYTAKNHVLNKDKKPKIKTYFKINYGTKHLSLEIQKKTGGKYSGFIQEFEDGSALYRLNKVKYYQSRRTSEKTVSSAGFHSFSEAVIYARNDVHYLIREK
jgi:hypothetical protein